MVGWHHRLNGHEFEQTLRDGEGQGSLACFSPRDSKDSDMTERPNNNLGPKEVMLKGLWKVEIWVVMLLLFIC